VRALTVSSTMKGPVDWRAGPPPSASTGESIGQANGISVAGPQARGEAHRLSRPYVATAKNCSWAEAPVRCSPLRATSCGRDELIGTVLGDAQEQLAGQVPAPAHYVAGQGLWLCRSGGTATYQTLQAHRLRIPQRPTGFWPCSSRQAEHGSIVVQ
jgi:hypothetical protein